MGDDITIGVTEIVNNIEVTAQPNDQIVDISVIDNTDEVTLNITPTVIEINVNKGSSYAKWGTILGTLSDQADLQDALDLKANLVDGKVPASELPSYVDDVIEVADYAALPTTGEIGKIYITLYDNKIYRWSGSIYIEIASNNAIWGAITGTLSNQLDLKAALDLKADDNEVVKLTTDQSIAGVKTFTNLSKFTNDSGSFALEIDTTTSDALVVKDGGTTKLQIGRNGEVLGAKYKVNGGFNTQFLKANGDLDSNTYALDSSVVKLTGNQSIAGWKTFTGGLTLWDNPSSNLLDFYVSSTEVGLINVGTSFFQFKAINSGGYLFKNSSDSNVLTITNTGAATFSSSLTANSIAKSGGTNTEFLKADGSIDSTSYQPLLTNPITGTGTTNYLPKFTGASTLGNSLIYDNGTNVGIGTTSPQTLTHLYTSTGQNIPTLGSAGGHLTIQTGGVIATVMGVNANGNFYIQPQRINAGGSNVYNTLLNPSGGNVGIGTTSPTSVGGYTALTVNSNSSGSFIDLNNSDNNNFRLLSLPSGDVRLQSSSRIRFDTNSSERMSITSGGNVVVNNLGTGTVYSNAGTLTNTNPSDERLKENIEDLTYGLNEILKLKPVSYNWKNDTINQGKQFGFIAQEVQEIMPDLISEFETKDGEEDVIRLGLDKEAIFVTMVNAIKEQNEVLEQLKAEIEILKNK